MNRHLLIIYPHWPPSNLAGMHRARLVANGARDCGWDITVITVHSDHYEEPLDQEMTMLIRPGIEVIQTPAKSILRVAGRRLIGDIGLRGYQYLKTAARNWLKQNRTDFVWMPIPSWYTPLMGPKLSREFNVPYGVDYIDPWVYQLTDHEPMFSRAWWTRQAALFLEPRAIRKAAIISGVAEKYFQPALQRTFRSKTWPTTVAFPYGFDTEDHRTESKKTAFPFDPSDGRYILYAGAFLPHSESFARHLFWSIAKLQNEGEWPHDLQVHFVGTGSRPGPSISALAEEIGIHNIVHEHRDRMPFLSIQSLLRRSFASLILGSTEPHYTASKTFQCLLAANPVLSILHEESSALSVLRDCQADTYSVGWSESGANLEVEVERVLRALIQAPPVHWKPNLNPLERHSAKRGAHRLLNAIESLKT